MVRKKELKQRAIYVYPPAEIAQRWKDQAERSGASISRFVIEHVENSLNAETDPDYQPRTGLIEENKKLAEALKEKDRYNHHLELLVDKQEEDLRVYRSRIFPDTGNEKVRDYDKRIVQILKETGPHTSDSLLLRLGVGPDDMAAVKAVSAQLEVLQVFGLVRQTSRGWTWAE
ncbi:MAG: hypothetical protein ABIJ47_14325 [Candidatus Bathyarchaeota archaeon]